MTPEKLLTGCELHIHMAGAYTTADILALGADIFREIDWHGRSFLTDYKAVYGRSLDPIRLFADALADPDAGFQRFKRVCTFNRDEGGDFERFMMTYRFFQRIWAYRWQTGRETAAAMVNLMLDEHRQQGLDYVEYRSGFWGDADRQIEMMRIFAECLQASSDDAFTARYIIPMPRTDPLAGYLLVRRLLRQHPHLIPTVVGVDFASQEEGFPPKLFRPFFQRLQRDNRRQPEQALNVVYHVGESYFDKSIESAIRWCHEAALLGASRLGHAIALGLDPEVAIARRPHAHETELISERLDQIAYDLRYHSQLVQYGVRLEPEKLRSEQSALRQMEGMEQVERPYTPDRLENIRRRQQFVLDELTRMGTVIECCPISNLRIGGVPNIAYHPIHRFLASDVNLVICTDDPGTFDITLRSEMEWVVRHTAYSWHALAKRLGDPRRFRLGQNRRPAAS